MNYLETTIEKLTSNILEYLTKAGHSVSLDDVLFEKPSNSKHGDICTNIAFKYANRFGSNPSILAQDISTFLTSAQIQYVEKIEAVKPGFINVTFNAAFYSHLVKEIIHSPNAYGKNDSLTGTKWVVEHTSPNPNKAMHLGHLRNNLTGMAISNIWEFIGIKVIRDCIDNDRGIAIAKLMWGYLKFARRDKKENTDINYWYTHQNGWNSPAELKVRPDMFADDLYVNGSKDFNEFEESEKGVRKLV